MSSAPEVDSVWLTHRAWFAMERKKVLLGLPDLAIRPLSDFLSSGEAEKMPREDKETILEQASLLFEHLYPHLPFKQKIYDFAHPVETIDRHVRPMLARDHGEMEFHEALIEVFSLVRDAHTLYSLPAPYRGAIAFLPFQMRFFVDSDENRRYIVTRVLSSGLDTGFGHPHFRPGAEITMWQDEPVDSYVARVAAKLPGGNLAASFTRGSVHATIRPLAFCQAPGLEELTPNISFLPPGGTQPHVIRLPWGLASGLNAHAPFPGGAFSVSAITHSVMKMSDGMLSGTHAPADDDPMFDSRVLENPLPGSNARFGYLRIKTFGAHAIATGAAVANFRQRLEALDVSAPDGLILDVRGNAGGDILAAESMLQMLTPHEISPALFHLANTAAMLTALGTIRAGSTDTAARSVSDDVKIADAVAELKDWFGDAGNQPLPHGDPLTSGHPLTNPGDANSIGQVYQGRVCLLIDALSYSAAEIFAAGFQDHAIGPVLGIDPNTGGGGANIWSHTDLLNKLGPMPGVNLRELPSGASMTIAIRRSSRTGPFKNKPVEDVGVVVDEQYTSRSVEDLMNDFPGLYRRACQLMSEKPPCRIDVEHFEVGPAGDVSVRLRTQHIETLNFLMDGRVTSQDNPATEAQTYAVPAAPDTGGAALLRIEGFTKGERSAVRTIRLQSPPPPDEETAAAAS